MIAILYPLKMDKNLSEAYSSIYESSLTSGSGSGSGRNAMSDGGDGVHRSFSQTANMFNKNIPAAKNGKVDKSTRKAVNTSAKDFGIQGPTTVKASHEPEGEMIDEKLSKEQQKKYDDHVKKMQDADKKKKKTGNPAFDDPSHHSFAKSKVKKNIFDSYNKYRTEWEDIKLNEMLKYRSQFDNWLLKIVEEGYDIERWTDDELLDTFIDENNLWESRESVDRAILSHEDEFLEEGKDKKGKGSGKKDACYKKVKAASDVWPSAYASGRLVQCRKVGAANYGKSKKEDFSDWRSDLQLNETEDGGIYENQRVARNPEKYPDPDESDKPYHKRSKAARMRDPKRGINSAAFKKFMADRGM